MVKEGKGVDYFLQIHNGRRAGYWLKVAIFKILATHGPRFFSFLREVLFKKKT
jgi:hypothetical protein